MGNSVTEQLERVAHEIVQDARHSQSREAVARLVKQRPPAQTAWLVAFVMSELSPGRRVELFKEIERLVNE